MTKIKNLLLLFLLTTIYTFGTTDTTGNSIGGFIWSDQNNNGIQDSSETGIANVEVRLYANENCTGAAIATTHSVANGHYRFDNLGASTYKHCIALVYPTNFTHALAFKGNNPDLDSNLIAMNSNMGKIENVFLDTGDITLDAGLVSTGNSTVKLGDRVFYDSNKNGIQDAAEEGVGGVEVKLYKVNNNELISTTQTVPSGIYLFDNVDVGEYYIIFTKPAGYTITNPREGNDIAKDSDAAISTGKTNNFTLVAGTNNSTIDMGVYQTTVSLGDKVFIDTNKNGLQDDGGQGVNDIKVTLYSTNNQEVKSTRTNANGEYLFTGLAVGDYSVAFSNIPNGYQITEKDVNNNGNDSEDSDASLKNGKIVTDTVSLTPGQNDLSWDLGIYLTNVVPQGATIGDKVFIDNLNGISNGIQDDGEQGVNDIKVTLYSANGQELNRVRTNANGEYQFINVPNGNYTIGFSELPEGYTFTIAGQGNDREKDSDVNANGRTNTIVIENLNDITSIDAGIKRVLESTANNDSKDGITGENVTLDVLANDDSGNSNFISNTVKITFIPDGANLSEDGRVLTVPNEGVWRVDSNTGAITFTPANGFVGDPTPITYSVRDEDGNETDAEVEINYPPVANDDNINAEIGQVVVLPVLDNDTNTSSRLNPASVRLIDPVSGNAVETVNVQGEGTWNVNADGSISFTPDNGFVGVPTPIQYIVREVAGDISNRAIITITYPDAVDDRVLIPNNNGDSEIIIDVAQNDTNNTVATEVTLGCQQPGVDTLVVNGEGTWRVASNGNVIFTPEANFVGQPTDIQYTIGLVLGGRSNCATISLQHELLVVDDTSALNVGGVTLINILNNDFGTLNVETVQLLLPVNPVAGSSVSADGKTLTVSGEGVWTVDSLGIVSFTAENGFDGVPTSIRYTVESNNALLSNIATVNLTQGGVSVVANNDVGIANGGNPIVINVLANDTGDINRSSVRIVGSNGEAVRELVVQGEGTWTVADDGTITFVGEQGFLGTPTPIQYIVSNNGNTLSSTGTIRINGTCDCTPYEASIPAMGKIAALLMLMLTLLISMFFLNKEHI